MNFTATQLNFFNAFGFLHVPGVLKSEMGWISEEFERVWVEGKRTGYDGQGKLHNAIVPFVDSSAKLCTLVDHPLLKPTLEGLLGPDYNYLASDGRPYAGDTGWHPDGSWNEPLLFLKVAFYLDPLTRESGALRVIPGSHRMGDRYQADARRSNDSDRQFGMPMSAVPSVAIETQPGDIAIFNHNTMHASFGGGGRRRMFTMNLGKHAETPEQVEKLREYLKIHLRTWGDRTHGEIMRATATPGRMRHLAQVIANEGHLVELRREFLEQAAANRAAAAAAAPTAVLAPA